MITGNHVSVDTFTKLHAPHAGKYIHLPKLVPAT